MLTSFLTSALLAIGASATPLVIRQTLASNDPVAPNQNLTWIGNPALPKVLLYNTGDGTILSGSTNGRTDNLNYGGFPGSLTPEYLIGNVSEVLQIAQIAVIFAAGGGRGSANANSDRFLNIGRDATSRMCGPDSDITGAVMIHGTNSLAETAFGIDLTFNCSKPFISTGSMRPNSALSADGPFNFYDAVRAAVHPESRDRGGLLSFDDHLISAFYGTKTNGNTVGTFKAYDQGYIAQFLGGQPYFFFGPSLPKARHYFDPFSVSLPMPPVVVLYGHQGFDASLLYAAAKNGVRGIVIMGVGPGGLSTNATLAANDLYATQGVITVASLRTFFGASVPGPSVSTVISSGFLHGEQSRIQLQLCLASGYNINQTRAVFESEIRQVVYNNATAFYNGTNLELP